MIGVFGKGKRAEKIHCGSENEGCDKKSTLKISTKHENQIQITNSGNFGSVHIENSSGQQNEGDSVGSARKKGRGSSLRIGKREMW
jgi:hypothetical protein